VPRRVAILQSNYIPWKGYFDILRAVDEFVLYDDAQYTKHDWRNRNVIKTLRGPLWLTIPVKVRGRLGQRIRDATVADPSWRALHWKSLTQWYRGTPGFERYRPVLEPLYLAHQETSLSEINRAFLEALGPLLGCSARLSWSWEYLLAGDRVDRLVGVCQQLGATEYLSGPAAKVYLDEARFEAVGIKVRWANYEGYPEYPQRHPPFEHRVSVLDLLFNVGADAPRYLKDVTSASQG
jgi:hypothetical protein